METWRLLGGLAGMLVLYAALATAFGTEITPVNLGVAVVFGVVGLYLGNVISERLTAGKE